MSVRTPGHSQDPNAAHRAQLAATFVERLAALDDLGDQATSEETRPLVRRLGEAALELALSIARRSEVLSELEREFDLLGSLLDVPSRLGAARETTLAVRVAEALTFCAPDDMKGQIALAHAQAGERPRALELVHKNLETAREPFIAEFRAGDVYRELGEADAAEAYYRRSLALANTPSARSEAALRIASLLIDTGREAAAVAFLAQQRAQADAASAAERPPATARPADSRTASSPVGRNDPCPCGSGKKYKKCHGA
ncbi:MAG TPA: SEC-C metal-binding domain-containing protein [Polyangiaceae bacterium]|jgi:tetratricopeptide (TPR) repeat protein|nr:SEC-C metal-binding domain-containing protein [Polyangiaceae bacterium]